VGRAEGTRATGERMADDVVVIVGLVKRYGSVVALNNVSLAVRRGEFIALLGPSGCGKTTLLRCAAGFVEPTAGEIRINGLSMTGIPPNHRPVNTVFQQYALFPHMTVVENVEFGPRRKRVPAAERARLVSEALAMVGLEGLGSRYPRELSGGQQQRVALARAMVNKPDMLLLDEPLGALDLKLRKRMQVELKRLHRQLGTTFLFVTHDQEEALTMADRIAVMREGAIVQLDSASEVYRNPASRYVADFIGEANIIEAHPGVHGFLAIPGAGETAYRSDGTAPTGIMIRPEDIAVGEKPVGSDAIELRATVVDKVFAGPSWRVFLMLPDGQELTAEPGHRAEVEQLTPGQQASIWWPAEAARILTR
jgi:spermidine/putrescine transport system ATP-binding protein